MLPLLLSQIFHTPGPAYERRNATLSFSVLFPMTISGSSRFSVDENILLFPITEQNSAEPTYHIFSVYTPGGVATELGGCVCCDLRLAGGWVIAKPEPSEVLLKIKEPMLGVTVSINPAHVINSSSFGGPSSSDSSLAQQITAGSTSQQYRHGSLLKWQKVRRGRSSLSLPPPSRGLSDPLSLVCMCACMCGSHRTTLDVRPQAVNK